MDLPRDPHCAPAEHMPEGACGQEPRTELSPKHREDQFPEGSGDTDPEWAEAVQPPQDEETEAQRG